jgi:flagellum-specific ATP synthase
VLSRELAEQSHFPAIDVPRSISRLARAVQGAEDRARAEAAVALLSTYDSARTLIETGVYRSGANPQIDAALEARPRLQAFLKQGSGEQVPAAAAGRALAEALGTATAAGGIR